jgi:biopolymer transport protein ExbD
MSTGGKKGGVQSDINVTPLIDVLLVLLIIFMVVMPIMMRMETVEVPRKLDTTVEKSNKTVNVTITVKTDLSVLWNDGSTKEDETIQAADLVSRLEPKLKLMAQQADADDPHPKVVFVAFDCGVKWKDVLHTMDLVRSLANDQNHDEISVAIKLKPTEEDKAKAIANGEPPPPESGDNCH